MSEQGPQLPRDDPADSEIAATGLSLRNEIRARSGLPPLAEDVDEEDDSVPALGDEEEKY